MGFHFLTVMIFLVSTLLSAVPSSTGRQLNEQDLEYICSKTHNAIECLNLFKTDPRSLYTDEKGLAGVAVDIALRKADEVHKQYNQLYRDNKDSQLQEKYLGCSKNYNDAIRDLNEVKNEIYANRNKLTRVEINDALQEVNACIRDLERDQIDLAQMNYYNEEFKLTCYMVKVTTENLVAH